MFCGIDLPMPDTATPDERPLTRLESALRYDRTPLLVLLLLLPLLSWSSAPACGGASHPLDF
jgi:hypothetical protein